MTTRKPKLLWIGDAVMQTGFARVTHNILMHLCETWDVVVLGINYNGDPHTYPYRIYPAASGQDVWGVHRVAGICEREKPDVVMILQDPWNIPTYFAEIPESIPVVAYMPVDAPNQMAGVMLNRLSRAITYTQWGRKELMLGGMTTKCDVIPHGVNADLYTPMKQEDARRELKLSKHVGEGAFIVGNINRNQPRKRLDITIEAWTQWWVNAGQPPNAYLYLHCSNIDIGWNVLQLTRYFGIQTQLIITDPNMTPSAALPEDRMPFLYNALDVQLNTSLGEGWGLTTHEGMACGIPQIVPDYAAFAEWAKGAVTFVPCTSFQVTASNINTIGGVVNVDGVAQAIDKLYRNPGLRYDLSVAARSRATEDRFKWTDVAEKFDMILLDVVSASQQAAAGAEVAQ